METQDFGVQLWESCLLLFLPLLLFALPLLCFKCIVIIYDTRRV